MDTKTFTLRDVAEAMLKDPTPQIVGKMTTRDSSASCALGGAGLMLGVSGEGLRRSLSSILCTADLPSPESRLWASPRTLASAIIVANDKARLTKEAIGRSILENCTPHLDKEFTIRRSHKRVPVARPISV